MSTEPLLDYLTPESLGLDTSKFPDFRRAQLEAIEKVTYSDKRVIVLALPTGSGKSLVPAAVGKLTSKRVVALTHTRGLQDQYLDDLHTSGMIDIRGRANYDCLQGGNCRDGAEEHCKFMRHGCTYEEHRDLARRASLVDGNYAYWFRAGSALNDLDIDPDTGEFKGDVEILVCDEGHAAPNILGDYIGFTLHDQDVDKYTEPLGEDVEEWASLAQRVIDDIKAELRTLRMELSHFKDDPKKRRQILRIITQVKATAEKMYKLASATSDDWVCEMKQSGKYGRSWKFDVIWPGRYAEKYLFCGIPKIVIMSATIRPKTMAFLGVAKEDFEFHEWPRVFPVNRCPTYYCPPLMDGKAVRITRKSTEEEMLFWVEHIDQIIDSRLDRRVVLLTTSYKYQRFFLDHSRHASFISGNTDNPESDTAAEAFEKFIVKPPPAVLCSPSYGTGWDFKDDRAEVLIIAKVPLREPGTASKLMAARLKQDKEWGAYETMQDVVQAAGRLQRSMKDRGEIVIADGSWGWFGPRHKHLAPKGFVSSVRPVKRLPAKPEKL